MYSFVDFVDCCISSSGKVNNIQNKISKFITAGKSASMDLNHPSKCSATLNWVMVRQTSLPLHQTRDFGIHFIKIYIFDWMQLSIVVYKNHFCESVWFLLKWIDLQKHHWHLNTIVGPSLYHPQITPLTTFEMVKLISASNYPVHAWCIWFIENRKTLIN